MPCGWAPRTRSGQYKAREAGERFVSQRSTRAMLRASCDLGSLRLEELPNDLTLNQNEAGCRPT